MSGVAEILLACIAQQEEMKRERDLDWTQFVRERGGWA